MLLWFGGPLKLHIIIIEIVGPQADLYQEDIFFFVVTAMTCDKIKAKVCRAVRFRFLMPERWHFASFLFWNSQGDHCSKESAQIKSGGIASLRPQVRKLLVENIVGLKSLLLAFFMGYE